MDEGKRKEGEGRDRRKGITWRYCLKKLGHGSLDNWEGKDLEPKRL